jgi:hypothetical protein
MTTRVRLLGLGLTIGLCFGVARAQEGPKVKAPDWKQGMELQVRKVGEKEFTKDTKRYGVEVYKDDNNGKMIYISETGAVAVLGDAKGTGVKDKAPDWKHGMELQVRKAGEKEFTKDTKTHSVEVFYDPVNSSLIYITDAGNLAVVSSAPPPESKDKAPTWVHAMELQARKAGEADFTKDTAKYGVEVFRDENNGNLIYIAQTGSIAVIPTTNVEKSKDFPWRYAMELRVRKAGEPDFNKDTQKFGVEVYRDDNDGAGIFISQTGALSVVPGMPGGEIKEKQAPEWKHGVELQARKAGEAEFSKNTKRYGLEVFKDPHTGNLIYITEQGAVPVVK